MFAHSSLDSANIEEGVPVSLGQVPGVLRQGDFRILREIRTARAVLFRRACTEVYALELVESAYARVPESRIARANDLLTLIRCT